VRWIGVTEVVLGARVSAGPYGVGLGIFWETVGEKRDFTPFDVKLNNFFFPRWGKDVDGLYVTLRDSPGA